MKRPKSNFLYKLSRWEFWPLGFIYLPIFFYWIWKSLKAHSLFFFSASNPSIETGGMLGESKWNILQKIPKEYLPLTVYVKPGTSMEQLVRQLSSKGIVFPVICKPDVGERGRLVEKINSPQELKAYLDKMTSPFLVQEFIDLPVELGVFYYRFPDQEQGSISSVVQKEFLAITGDSFSTVEELAEKNPRARFQMTRLFKKTPSLKTKVPDAGEILELEPIGNHCRGTAFFDASQNIDDKIASVFNEISKQIPGFYYGRYDLRCSSIDDLKKGENFKIIELNGAGSEPAHIYNPGYTIFRAWKTLFRHWDVLYKISIKNHERGVPFMTLPEAINRLLLLRKR